MEWQKFDYYFAEEPIDEDEKQQHFCGLCGQRFHWSADDISGKYEQDAFMPCGHEWQWLDRIGASEASEAREVPHTYDPLRYE